MFGALLIRGILYSSRVALTADAIYVLALALAIVGFSIYFAYTPHQSLKLNADSAVIVIDN
jgi:hypothetical protein